MADVKTAPGTMERPMKIRILSGVVIAPGMIGQPGEIWEVPRADGIIFVNHGLAELYREDGDPPEPTRESIGVEVIVPTNRDPKPRKIKH